MLAEGPFRLQDAERSQKMEKQHELDEPALGNGAVPSHLHDGQHTDDLMCLSLFKAVLGS